MFHTDICQHDSSKCDYVVIGAAMLYLVGHKKYGLLAAVGYGNAHISDKCFIATHKAHFTTGAWTPLTTHLCFFLNVECPKVRK